MKLKDLVRKGRMYFATALALLPAEQIIAGNISGTTRSIPTLTPVQTIVYAIDNANPTDTTRAKSNPSTGQFSMNLPEGNYTLEAVANNHYDWKEPNFNVTSNDTSLDLRLIRGQYDNGTPILVSPHAQSHGSILAFAKTQYERNDGNPDSDVINWPSERRRLYIDPTMDSLSRKNLDSVLARNTAGSFGTRYYDIQPTDSAEGGIRILLGTPSNGDAYTDIGVKIVSENPLLRNIIGAEITIRSDISRPIPKRIFADELSHAEGQHHHSLWQYHVLTAPLTQSLATETSDDELYISAMNQTQIMGTNWNNHQDTIKTIPENTTDVKQQVLEKRVDGMKPAYPNPTNGELSVDYQVKNAGRIKIQLYNVLGQEVRTIVNGNLQPGDYTAKSNVTKLPSGFYIMRYEDAQGLRQVNKIIITN